MSRLELHSLVDRIPDREILAAQRFLEYLAAPPACRAAQSAPVDDEPVTEADILAIERAQDDIQGGRISSHDDALRDFHLK